MMQFRPERFDGCHIHSDLCLAPFVLNTGHLFYQKVAILGRLWGMANLDVQYWYKVHIAGQWTVLYSVSIMIECFMNSSKTFILVHTVKSNWARGVILNIVRGVDPPTYSSTPAPSLTVTCWILILQGVIPRWYTDPLITTHPQLPQRVARQARHASCCPRLLLLTL